MFRRSTQTTGRGHHLQTVRPLLESLEPRALMDGTMPLGALPALDSYPNAKATLYLDFNGETTNHGYGQWITEPAYDLDGDPATFTKAELDNIREIWSR